MTKIEMLKNLHKEESGQDLIEYALIGLLIALGAIAGMSTLASSINAEFTKIGSKTHLGRSQVNLEERSPPNPPSAVGFGFSGSCFASPSSLLSGVSRDSAGYVVFS